MENVLEDLIFWVATAAASGLTFLAYKHPSTYARFYTVLMPMAFFVFCGTQIWRLAVQKTYYALQPLISAENFDAAQNARETTTGFSGETQTFLIFFGVTVFLGLLRILHDLIPDDEK